MKDKDKAEAIMEVAEQAQRGNLEMLYLFIAISGFFLTIFGAMIVYIYKSNERVSKENRQEDKLRNEQYMKQERIRNARQDKIMEETNKLVQQNCKILAVHEIEIKMAKEKIESLAS